MAERPQNFKDLLMSFLDKSVRISVIGSGVALDSESGVVKFVGFDYIVLAKDLDWKRFIPFSAIAWIEFS